MNETEKENTLALLYDRAVYGVNNESASLAELGEAAGADLRSFELTAAAIGLIDLKTEDLPTDLRARLLTDAEAYFAMKPASTRPDVPGRETIIAETPRHSSFFEWLGWAVAAAACIAFAVNMFLFDSPSDTNTVQNPAPPVKVEPLTPSQNRQRLLDSAGDVARAEWRVGNVKELKDIAGDVVWSDSKQAGYIRLNGLPANDPSKATYQLWIFDETQDPKTPIDGGTFDISAAGEVIIPIDARLKARNPKMFAVTIEKAGGVVVSKQEKVAAIAKIET